MDQRGGFGNDGSRILHQIGVCSALKEVSPWLNTIAQKGPYNPTWFEFNP